MSDRYKKSEDLLNRALKTIPLGSQTFSKSLTQYPLGVSPYFAEKAKGSHLWDVDGNEYIDFINSLAAITIGYNDDDINKAVIEQIEKGTIFSLSNNLEIEVAEKIVSMVPCAEMVRFGKNGSDATAAAVRVARAYTGKEHIAVCGYHGWQDWYIGSTSRNLGVPESTINQTHKFTYNDINSLQSLFEAYPNKIAAVIMEPMNTLEPQDRFLEKVQALTHENEALLIFDETITGFRYANGGAQELFNVIPDLATFGKGLANGYPISAVTGKKKYMALFEEIFFSFTYGGETLSLAAALATMNKLEKKYVVNNLRVKGEKLINKLNALIEKNKLQDLFKITGNPVKSFFVINKNCGFDEWVLKTYFLQHMFSEGVLILTTHNLSYAHSDEDIEKLLLAYESFFNQIKNIDDSNELLPYLECEPLKPLFEIRK